MLCVSLLSWHTYDVGKGLSRIEHGRWVCLQYCLCGWLYICSHCLIEEVVSNGMSYFYESFLYQKKTTNWPLYVKWSQNWSIFLYFLFACPLKCTWRQDRSVISSRAISNPKKKKSLRYGNDVHFIICIIFKSRSCIIKAHSTSLSSRALFPTALQDWLRILTNIPLHMFALRGMISY